MSTSRYFRFFLIATASSYAVAAQPSPTQPKSSPVEISVNTSLGYDSNVYLVDEGRLGRVDSAVSILGAKIGAKFASGAAFSYAATGSNYWNASDESNVKHVLATSFNQKYDTLSLSGSSEFAQVQGDNTGVIFGVPNKSTFTTPAPRERRDQFQNKTDLAVRFDTSLGFVRGGGKLQYWDMQTHAVVGADNYRDRYDLNGGADFGRAFTQGGPEYYLGYRRGYFYHDTDSAPAITKNATSHYDRYLLGFDGKLTPSLKVSAQAGWAINDYTASYQSPNASIEGLFTDITVTWSASTADQVQFKTAQGRTLSSSGQQSILATMYQGAWTHDFNKQWSSTLTARISKNNYAGGSTGSALDRDDQLYSGITALTWKSSAHLAWTLSASYDVARNLNDNLSATAENQAAFDRAYISLGVNWKL